MVDDNRFICKDDYIAKFQGKLVRRLDELTFVCCCFKYMGERSTNVLKKNDILSWLYALVDYNTCNINNSKHNVMR
jgi:hypothetical protein